MISIPLSASQAELLLEILSDTSAYYQTFSRAKYANHLLFIGTLSKTICRHKSMKNRVRLYLKAQREAEKK